MGRTEDRYAEVIRKVNTIDWVFYEKTLIWKRAIHPLPEGRGLLAEKGENI